MPLLVDGSPEIGAASASEQACCGIPAHAPPCMISWAEAGYLGNGTAMR